MVRLSLKIYLKKILALLSLKKKMNKFLKIREKCGYRKFVQGKVETADSIMPIYLRKSQAERLKKQK